MGFLIPYLFCALFLLAMYILMRLVIKITLFFTSLRFLSDGKATVDSVAAYMICRFGEKNVIFHRYFPMSDGSYEEIPLIVIMKTGVAVIQAKNARGNLTPMGEVWHQSYVNRYGDTKASDFPNPVIENQIHAEALTLLFRQARLRKPKKLLPITVLPSERVRFHGALPKEVVTTMTLPRFLKENDRGKKFSRAERKAILQVLSQNAKIRRQVPTSKNQKRR